MPTYRLTVLRTVVAHDHYIVVADDEDDAATIVLNGALLPITVDEQDRTDEVLEIEEIQ